MTTSLIQTLISIVLCGVILVMIRWMFRHSKSGRQSIHSHLPALIKSQLSDDTVVLSAPTSLRKLLVRCRFSALLLMGGLVRLAAFSEGSQLTIVALLLFCGGLEYLAGASAVGWCFFGPLIVASQVQTWIFHCPTGFDFLLGALGCVGGLVWFLKHRAFLIGFFVTYAVVERWLLKDPRAIGFMIAFLVGLTIMKVFLEIKDRRLIT